MTAPSAPVPLPANQPTERFYAGGAAIADFRGTTDPQPFTPEDWIASVTEVRGQGPAGLSALPDGTLLADAVASDPTGWLGAAHVARWGADPRLLVKLLDAGQRLPVHAHPGDAFAALHLGTAHGKAEAWYILRGGRVHLGLREPVSPHRLRSLVRDQEPSALLPLLHTIEVAPHDSVLVPPGTLHAIGAGVLLAEVQQPEDLSILLEWEGFAIDGSVDGHLGLGFDTALAAVDGRALSAEGLESLVRRGTEHGPALPSAADGWFRIDIVGDGDALDAGFAIVIGEAGALDLSTASGLERIATGSTTLVPAAAGDLAFAGSGRALVARPPHPAP